jgi:hypothetical protein
MDSKGLAIGSVRSAQLPVFGTPKQKSSPPSIAPSGKGTSSKAHTFQSLSHPPMSPEMVYTIDFL